MTWDHSRGFDPLVACAAVWREKTGVDITWDRRSLQYFESYPVEDLATRYDLIVIDHPHVGQITAAGCLHPLEDPDGADARIALADASVGPSFDSYRWEGRQWAFPIDAAAQVQAWCPDRIGAPVDHWTEVVHLVREGQVLWPLRPPHALLSLFSLASNRGPGLPESETVAFVDAEAGRDAYDQMAAVVAHLDQACFAMDPIAAFEAMAEPGAKSACVPLAYGYANYAARGFRPVRLAFADMPVLGDRGPVGSALGGTGIAVSARSTNIKAATNFAYWIADGEVQKTIYQQAGRQPGHAAAWDDSIVNAHARDFYQTTRRTLDGASVRPRHSGYMSFQDTGSERVISGLKKGEDARRVVADLNKLFRQSLQTKKVSRIAHLTIVSIFSTLVVAVGVSVHRRFGLSQN